MVRGAREIVAKAATGREIIDGVLGHYLRVYVHGCAHRCDVWVCGREFGKEGARVLSAVGDIISFVSDAVIAGCEEN